VRDVARNRSLKRKRRKHLQLVTFARASGFDGFFHE
jgi:hypothetical protein